MSQITDTKSLDLNFEHRFGENNYGLEKLKSGEERIKFQLNMEKLHQALERNSRAKSQ